MQEPILNCGRNGDELCGVRKGDSNCPYWDNENCLYFRPDSNWTHPSKDRKHSATAKALIQLSEEYLSEHLDEMEDEVYAATVTAYAFMIMKITPEQAQAMINSAKMESVRKQLESFNVEEAFSKEEQE